MSHLVEDCLRIIFIELQYDSSSLYSCILVNRFWCQIAIPILWKDPYNTYIRTSTSLCKLHNMIIYLLPKPSKQLLIDNNIITDFSNQPLFNYISFSSKISFDFIDKMVESLIKKEIEPLKYKILEQEVYKLFVNHCNIRNFILATTQPLFQYPGAQTCFSQLNELIIDIQRVSSTVLFGMAQICQNIESLNIYECSGDIPGLIYFIDIQKKLKSLDLEFKTIIKQGVDWQCKELSNVIERKAATLKYISISPNITFLSPKFLLSLINLEYLCLSNGHRMDKESVVMQEWRRYLSIASFPNLQYLRISSPPFFKEYTLVEKTNGNITSIQIYNSSENAMNIQRLIKAIAQYCPKLESLIICPELENLEGIKEIFLNCIHLKSIEFLKDEESLHICDKLLENLAKFSSKSLHKVTFKRNWIFTIEGLRNFFENWRDRIPIIFNNYIDVSDHFTNDHVKIFKKYYDEGVIKWTNIYFRFN